jgi:hypothetical protein
MLIMPMQFQHFNASQNFVFSSKSGDIAIRQQGAFVAKWKQQGDFVMPRQRQYLHVARHYSC